jgi:MFS transporter, SET family, sugar efflux transporter
VLTRGECAIRRWFLYPSKIAYWFHMPVVPPLRSLSPESPRVRHLSRLATTPGFLPLISAILFVGLGNAVGGSYLTLYVVDKAHLSPLALGAFLTVYSLSGMMISTVFGRWFDRAPSPIPLLFALFMTVSGYALLSVTTNFYLLLLIAAVPLGTSLAVFPQLFALAKGRLDRAGSDTAESGTAMMRATWSIAWAIGPALGALVISLFDFRGVFLTAALCSGSAIVIVALTRVDALRLTAKTGFELKPETRSVRQAGFAASSLTMFHMAMFMGSIALPVVATHELNGTKADVGLIFSVCAFLEVPVMLAFVLRPSVWDNRRWISAGFIAFILYFLTITWGPSVTVLLAAQVLRAVGIGLIAYQGISYMQALLPTQAGAAATLFSNTANAGFLLASLTAGGWVQAFGYRSTFLACAFLSALGIVMMRLQGKGER